MNIPILDLKPEIQTHWEEYNQAFQNVLRSGQFILGPSVTLLEKELASYLGVEHAVGLNSGTDALIIGLEALGVGAGDEVITTSFTFFATAEAISQVGATPVFVDIDPETFNVDPNLIEAKITPRTKAILPVHLFGHAVAMDKLLDISAKYSIPVLEDVAQAFGAEFRGKKLGSLGHVGAFSFFPSKNLGAFGDAGLLVTNDAVLAEKARMLRVHGSKRRYHNECLGYNSRLDELQAAFLRIKLPRIDAMNAGRRVAAKRYQEVFSGWNEMVVPTEKAYATHVYHQFTVRILDGKRNGVNERLAELGVSTMIYYPIACHRFPMYLGSAELKTTDAATDEVLSLPIWPEITPEIQLEVASRMKIALNK
jgi:dTDP-4-amino-4,6-dideoxygalactose transaminase